MSRTDNTKPLWVRSREHDPRPVHDHRFGPCDLPPRPTRETTDTRCQWEHPESMLFGRATCCAGCNKRSCYKEWQDMVRSENRKDRHGARRAAHEAARRYATGLEGDEA
ncbi:hypothetical protein GCM10009801_66130 [Streptomyces albiaxialis]|uniref:4Fe-4S Wbl-type domain-containing protein n=1 Tax=Streptomyces albiaxialis TaxID=329523 RepID=A0ABN2WRT2_9ACTN